jgi:hypothetical protein
MGRTETALDFGFKMPLILQVGGTETNLGSGFEMLLILQVGGTETPWVRNPWVLVLRCP